MPGNLYMAYDTDMLDQINGNTLKFFTDYSNNGKYLGVNIQDLNIHVMNKFSLGRAIDKEFENE